MEAPPPPPPPLLQLLASTSQGSPFYSYSPGHHHRNVGHIWGISSLLFQTEMELNGFCLFSAAQRRGAFLMAVGGGAGKRCLLGSCFMHSMDVRAPSLLP